MHTLGSSRTGASSSPVSRALGRATLWAWILLALALRLPALTLQPLWWDEGWSVYFAQVPIADMLRLTAVDIHPPLYYLLLHVWTSLFGPSVLSIRLLSVLIGIAAVPLMYAVGERLVDRRAGLMVAFLLVISPLHIYYSQEVRMYGLVTLAGLAALYFALAWRASDGSREHVGAGTWLGYVVSAAAAIYTQYYAAFLLLALNILVIGAWWRRRPGRRGARSWLGAQAAVVALVVPWLLYAGPRLLTYVRYKVGVEQDPSFGPILYLARHLAAFQWGHAEGMLASWWWAGLVPLALGLIAIALWFLRTRRPSPAVAANIVWPVGIVLVVLACGFAVNLILPFNPPRFERLLLLALPAYLLAAGLIITWLVPRREEPGLVAGRAAAGGVILVWLAASIVSLAFFYTVPRYPDDDYRPVAAQVAALSTPEDAILTVHPWQAGYFYAYLPKQDTRPTIVLTPREVLPREKQFWAEEPGRMAADLDALLSAHSRIWFADHQAMGRVLEAQIEAYLVAHAYPTLHTWHGPNTVLSLFAAGDPQQVGPNARMADWLALEHAAIALGPQPAGSGVIPVRLTWQVVAPQPAGYYRVGLRLVGTTGHVWAQRDTMPLGGLADFSEWPAGEPPIDRHGLLVPAGTPPGDYQVTVRVYDEESLSVLPAAFAGGSGGEVLLGTVRVTRPERELPVEALAYGGAMALETAVDVEVGPLRLVGCALDDADLMLPGEAVQVVLFWQAVSDPGEDFYPWLALGNAAGERVAEVKEKPVAGTYPTAWWQAGDLVRDPHEIPIPATAGPGRYRVAAGLVRAGDGELLYLGSLDYAVGLGDVTVVAREHTYTAPAPSHEQQAALGERILLVGYDLSGLPAEPGGTLHAVLYWHALQTPEQHYHTFVHLLDAGGEIVAQSDGVPGDGALPTLGWLPGEYIADPQTIALPADLSPGTYRLTIGLYEPVSGFRPGEAVVLDVPVVIGE